MKIALIAHDKKKNDIIYKIKNQGKDIAAEIDELTDEEFLNKAKVTINGKITKTAMLLLGKNESDYLIEDYNPKITWKLYDENNVIDYEHFGIPFIISVEKNIQVWLNKKVTWQGGAK